VPGAATTESGGRAGGLHRASSLVPVMPGTRKSRGRIKASLEHALLGLIAERRMVSGYELKQLFDRSMAHYWHAHHGQIYPTLELMKRRGWIRRRDVIQKGRPNKRLYTITEQGQQRLIEWLETPFEGMRIKHAPLLRCRFLGHLGAAGARQKLQEERSACIEFMNTYRTIEREVFRDGRAYDSVNAMFTYFTLRRGITMMEENIAWCDWAITKIDENAALFAKSGARKAAK
jgi:DNA-binding PadR family transcriptional regulator